MEVFDVVVQGFPTTMAQKKIELFIKGRFRKEFKVTKFGEGKVGIKIFNAEDVPAFPHHCMKEVQFGSQSYPLTYLKLPAVIPEMSENMRMDLYNNTHRWEDLEQLPAPAGSKCVLVQNIQHSTYQVVKMHFESRRRAGGGRVSSMIRIEDGLLVTFYDQQNCDSCVIKPDQKIDGNVLKLFIKRVPSYHERKFAITGVGESTTEDHLMMFLERCTNEDASPISCQKKSTGCYIIEYDDEFDIAETDDFIAKVSSEQLEQSKLKAVRMLCCDCLKVTNIPSTANDYLIQMTFESKRRASGGVVTRVVRREDGTTLVYFADYEDAHRAYNRFKRPCDEKLMIKEVPVQIELHYQFLDHDEIQAVNVPDLGNSPSSGRLETAETYYDRKFVLEGVRDDTQDEEIKILAELCTGDELAPKSVVKQPSGVFLIEFDEQFDEAHGPEFMEKVSKRCLGNNTIKVSRLLCSYCIKLSKVPLFTSDQLIKDAFGDTNLGNLGPITEVKRLRSGTVFVTFENHTDAERICDRLNHSQNPTFRIDGIAVDVELYHHSLSKEYEEDEYRPPPVKLERSDELQFKPTCNKKVFTFLQSNEYFLAAIREKLETIAVRSVELCSDGKNGQIVKLVPENEDYNEDDLIAKCKTEFQTFVATFSSKSKSFKRKKLEKARSLNLHPLLENAQAEESKEITIRWNDNAVELTGLKDVVESALENIEKCIELGTVEITIDEVEFRTLTLCGIFEDLKQDFRDVSFKFCRDKNLLSVVAPDTQLLSMQKKILKNSIKKRRIAKLNQSARRYLIETVAVNRAKIQDEIKAKDVKAEFIPNEDDVYINSRSEEDHNKVTAIIADLTWVLNFKVAKNESDVIGTEVWKEFVHEIGKENCAVYEKADNSIDIVGLTDGDADGIQEKFKSFLKEHAIKVATILLNPCQAKFVFDYCEKFNAENPKRKALKHFSRLFKPGGTLRLEGTEKSIEEAQLEINGIVAGMVTEKHSRSNPAIKSYYLDPANLQTIKSIQRSTHCYIEAMSPTLSEAKGAKIAKHEAKASNTTTNVHKMSQSMQRARFTLTSCKVDIVTHSVDGIINIIVRNSMALHPFGVSGAIKRYDIGNANQIEREMKAVKDQKGNLPPTEAFITSAGNLPNCRKIIHVIGPEWEKASHDEQSRFIFSCIGNILKVAEEANLSSIALPAIGCGIAQVNPNVGIPRIVNAVSQYFQQHPASCITQVDFVEIKNQKVLDEFQKVLKQIETRNKPINPRIPGSPGLSRPIVTAPPTALVQIGDIVRQKADAVVNIMAKDHIGDMTNGSAISKVLAAAAGNKVVKECAGNSGKYDVGDIFVTSAGEMKWCKNIVHGIVSAYDKNSAEVVKMIVKKALQHAIQANHRSIVFPAIGTGRFNMPPNEVAKWMKQAIQEYGSKSINIKIVVHVSNRKAVDAFQAEFNPTSMSKSSYVSYGSLSVCITDGDMLQRNDDVIVNSAHMTFDLMRAGPLSAAILRDGGSEIQNELKNSSGRAMAVTSGGKLPCKHIIHLVSRSEESKLKKTIVKALMKADSLEASSIVFPALGTGNINKPAKDAALLLHSALQEFTDKHPTPQNLKRMTVVVFNQTMVKDYIAVMVGYRGMRKKTFKAKVKGFPEFFSSFFEKDTADQTVDFHFYASDKKDIAKALEYIDKNTTEILHEDQIEDIALDAVTELEMLEFQEKAKENNVSIQKVSNKTTALLVTGLENDVKVFSDYCRKIIRELAEAQTCVEFVTWEVQGEVDENWYEFPPRPAHLLEKAFQQKKQKLGPVQVKMVEDHRFVLKSYDLSTLDKENSNIRRRQTENYELPIGWDSMEGVHQKRILLENSSEEYKRVLNTFKQNGPPFQTAKIERIQNISLYKKYAAEKAEVTEKLEGENVQIERELFHGTNKSNEIVKRGFNRAFAGTNAAKFGKGVYFATTARYSHQFTNEGARTIFLANVITGTYTQGVLGMVTAPDRSDSDLYDSVVDNVSNPSMFVVFKDASAYPTYLIEYT